MTLLSFLLKNYNRTDVLESPMFYNNDVGIRFEIGSPSEDNLLKYQKEAFERAASIFSEVLQPEDDIYFVVDYWYVNHKRVLKNIEKLLYSYNKKFKIERLYYKDAEMYRYSVSCKIKDVKVSMILRNIISEEDKRIYAGSFYFINKSNGVVYHLYDDRGLDLVAPHVTPLQKTYTKYENWILEYNKDQIKEVFDN